MSSHPKIYCLFDFRLILRTSCFNFRWIFICHTETTTLAIRRASLIRAASPSQLGVQKVPTLKHSLPACGLSAFSMSSSTATHTSATTHQRTKIIYSWIYVTSMPLYPLNEWKHKNFRQLNQMSCVLVSWTTPMPRRFPKPRRCTCVLLPSFVFVCSIRALYNPSRKGITTPGLLLATNLCFRIHTSNLQYTYSMGARIAA